MTRIRFDGCDLSLSAPRLELKRSFYAGFPSDDPIEPAIVSPGLTVRLRLAVLVPMVLVLAAVAIGCALAANGKTAPSAAATPTKLELGKQLYRKFCGQCHALTQALAAGFGSDKGLGQDGGPSFNNLRVPYNLSIVAVTEQFGGHELVVKRMTWDQLNQTAAFVATATRSNPYLARISDG
jgi:mono/diheme cytochrome c family protein